MAGANYVNPQKSITVPRGRSVYVATCRVTTPTRASSVCLCPSLPRKTSACRARIEPLLGWQPCRAHFPPDSPEALLLARVPVAAPPPRRISLPAPLPLVPLHCQARARRTRFECLVMMLMCAPDFLSLTHHHILCAPALVMAGMSETMSIEEAQTLVSAAQCDGSIREKGEIERA